MNLYYESQKKAKITIVMNIIMKNKMEILKINGK